MKWELSIVALSVLAVASFSSRLTASPITPAMVFVGIGLVAGPLVTGEVSLPPTGATVRTLAEATLAVVLFADASRIRLRSLRREYSVPVRLLGIGLPLTIVLGTLVAKALFTHLKWAEAVVLGVILAPTDAALGQSVVTEPALPSRIRQGLNVESGLNDGICVPLLLVALAVADVEGHVMSSGHAFRVLAEEIGYGALGGVAAGLIASVALSVAGRRHLIAGSWLQIIPVSAAALSYGLATGLGGSGFIAAFVAGMVFGHLTAGRPDEAEGRNAEEAEGLNEELGELLAGVTLLVFGAVLLGPRLSHLTWQVVVYAVASLTAVRMLPVAAAMVGSHARRATVAFLGWFGPRGLASIVFAVIVVQEAHLPGTGSILLAAYATVGLSVFAHGLSAAPLASAYVRWYDSHPRDRRPKMESVPVTRHRSRGGLTAGRGRSRAIPGLASTSGAAAAAPPREAHPPTAVEDPPRVGNH